MIKTKNLEMRIYELMGIKHFRNMAFKLRDGLFSITHPKMSKEQVRERLYSTPSNYNIGKMGDLKSIKAFKKQLFFNGSVHTFGVLVLVPDFIKMIEGTCAIPTAIFATIFGGINLYCVILQRYNYIRLNELIKKMTPRYERQRETLKEELRQEESLLLDHSYTIVDKKQREKPITFEELIEKADLDQLKKYREYISYYALVSKAYEQFKEKFDVKTYDLTLPMPKKETLRLVLRPNPNNGGMTK